MSERIYGWLLLLYPAHFRQEYGEAMRQVFRDRLKTENPLVLWAEVLRDLAVSVPREHWRPRQSAASTPGFTLSEEALRRMMKHNHHGPELSAGAITSALGMVVGLLGKAPHWPLFSAFAAMLVLQVTMTLQSRKHVRRHWRGFEAILEADRIIVKQGGVTETFLKSEITLLEMPGFGLLIQVPPDRATMLPELLTGYQELRETLITWVPVETQAGITRRKTWFTRFLRMDVLLTVYVLALLVRSPYFMFPLTCIASVRLLVPLLAIARTPSKSWLIPLALLVPLAVNMVFTLRH